MGATTLFYFKRGSDPIFKDSFNTVLMLTESFSLDHRP